MSALLTAIPMAIRTHLEEKREYLRNAILNIALKNETDGILQTIFLNYIDEFTPSHVRVLSFFAYPVEWWFKANKIPMPDPKYTVLHNAHFFAFPYEAQIGILDQIINTLRQRGLINVAIEFTNYGTASYKASHLGDRFLSFIKNPLPEDK